MSSPARRKAYSTSFRQDWVLPNDYLRCEDSESIPPARNGAISKRLVDMTNRPSHSNASNTVGEGSRKTKLISTEKANLRNDTAAPERPRTKHRYATSHSLEWTVIDQPNGQVTPDFLSSPIYPSKRNEVLASKVSHIIPSNTERRTSPQSQMEYPPRPSSSDFGYDAPPKPPFEETSYTPH